MVTTHRGRTEVDGSGRRRASRRLKVAVFSLYISELSRIATILLLRPELAIHTRAHTLITARSIRFRKSLDQGGRQRPALCGNMAKSGAELKEMLWPSAHENVQQGDDASQDCLRRRLVRADLARHGRRCIALLVCHACRRCGAARRRRLPRLSRLCCCGQFLWRSTCPCTA